MKKSPFKQVEKARMQKMKEDNSFRLGQMISNKGDTTSFELRPTGTGETVKKPISNEEYKKRMSGTVTPIQQIGEVDPMLTNAQGMPVDPMQTIQPMQPINVGMPGSTPIRAGVGHNMQQPVQAGGRSLSPISPITVRSTDPPEIKKKITSYIKGNMNNMSDADLMKGIGNFNPDGKTEYNWNKKTGSVEAHDKQGPSSISGGKNPNVGKPYNSALRQNGKVEKVDAITGSIQKSNEGPIVRTKGAGRANPHVNFTAFDGSAIKLPSVQQQVDKYDKQVKDENARKRLIQAYKSTK